MNEYYYKECRKCGKEIKRPIQNRPYCSTCFTLYRQWTRDKNHMINDALDIAYRDDRAQRAIDNTITDLMDLKRAIGVDRC